ncbi:MAG: DUF4397 domain-containing protein [Bacillota bacterium]
MFRYYPYFRQALPQPVQPCSYIRLLHASPGTPVADVYINNGPAASYLAFKSFTEYMRISPGVHNIKVFPAGNRDKALLDTDLTIPVRSILTCAIIGLSPDIGIKTFFETVVRIEPGKLRLRFSNLVPGSPDLDLVLRGGQTLFEEVSYGKATNYALVPSGTYTFYLQQSGTDRSLLYVPNIRLTEGRFYTIYAVGQTGGEIPLQVLIPVDGNSYIQAG